jgi:hypothetical protein
VIGDGVIELPAFAKQRTELVWTRDGRTLRTRTPEVAFSAIAHWYSFGRWSLTATSRLALPAHVTAYVSRGGGGRHGYWRNAPIGLAGYFGYCDVPALMPLVIGPQTRAALLDYDTQRRIDPTLQDMRSPVVLHIHDGTVETTAKAADDDSRALDDLIAIHHALAADHEDVLDSWKRAADVLAGTLSTAWPPLIEVPRAFGATTIALRWPPSTQAGSTASIELVADARGAKLWSIEREAQPTPNAIDIAGRPFLVMGRIPIAFDQLARVVARTEIMAITVRRYATVRIAGHTPDPDVLEHVLDLLGAICMAPSEPYR